MKSIPVAAVAVVVLWIGLSTFWMSGSSASQGATSNIAAVNEAPQSCAMMTAMGGNADGGGASPGEGGMPSAMQGVPQGDDAAMVTSAAHMASAPGVMTEPMAPVLGLHELFPTPPPTADIMTRLQAVEDRLSAALDRMEAVGTDPRPSNEAPRTESQPTALPESSMARQFLSVITSGPVIGFLLVLLLVLANAARGRQGLHGIAGRLHRSPIAQAARNSALGTTLWSMWSKAQDLALAALRSSGLDNPQGRTALWGRLLARVGGFQQVILNRAEPMLTRMGLDRRDPAGTDAGPATTQRIYGDVIRGTDANGRALQAGVFEEGQVRAAAGLTLALGTMAFSYAYFAKIYAPIQLVTILFFVEFLIRVVVGIRYSPMGMIAHWLTRRQTPQWVSAKPKRFAWTLGLIMSFAMMIITNSDIRGPLPLTICLICLTLMWLEAVLGLCLGCEIHGFLVRRGWAERDEEYEICANGACVVDARA